LSHAAHLTIKTAFFGFNAISTGAGVLESWFNNELDQAGFRLFAGLGGFGLLNKIPTCFPAGTKVLVEGQVDSGSTHSSQNRYKDIEFIKPGDSVLAYSEQSRDYVVGRVVNIYERRTTRLRRIRVDGAGSADQILKPTPEHPFWIEGKGWTPAADVLQGDVVRLSGDVTGRIRANEQEDLAQEVAVYNFEVADHHTYFVAEAEGHPGVLVHNADYNTLLKAIRADFQARTRPSNHHADSLEDALNAIKSILGPEAVELPPGFQSETYLDAPPGTKKWFRIEPPDGPDEHNREYHVKFADWTRGKKGTGGVDGHITFPESDYWRFLDLLTSPSTPRSF
jgi:hypothetical protein